MKIIIRLIEGNIEVSMEPENKIEVLALETLAEASSRGHALSLSGENPLFELKVREGKCLS